MLRSFVIRSCRAAGSVLVPSPNNRSKTARGLLSMGSGVVGVLQLSVLIYAQLNPASQAPAKSGNPIPTSSDPSWVCWPNVAAAI